MMKAFRIALSMLISGALVVALAPVAVAATTTYRIAFAGAEFGEQDFNGDGDTDDIGEYEVGGWALKKGGEKVGHLNFQCVVTQESPPRNLCWTAIRITGKGLVIAHGSQAAGAERFTGAVTGGTGAYRGASGVIKIKFGRVSTLTVETD